MISEGGGFGRCLVVEDERMGVVTQWSTSSLSFSFFDFSPLLAIPTVQRQQQQHTIQSSHSHPSLSAHHCLASLALSS